MAKVKHVFEREACPMRDMQQCLSETHAGAAMTTELVTARRRHTDRRGYCSDDR